MRQEDALAACISVDSLVFVRSVTLPGDLVGMYVLAVDHTFGQTPAAEIPDAESFTCQLDAALMAQNLHEFVECLSICLRLVGKTYAGAHLVKFLESIGNISELGKSFGAVEKHFTVADHDIGVVAALGRRRFQC